ncbi:MAG: energy transducer TonB [Acidobacteriota bacterium]
MKRRVLAVVAACGLVASLAVAQSVQELLTRAKGLMDRKQYTLALETVEKVLATENGNKQALAMKEEAERLLKAAEAEGKIDQMLAEARTYIAAKANVQAAKRLKEILELVPDQAEAKKLLGDLELDSDLDLLASETSESGVKEGDFVDVDKVDVQPQLVKQVQPVYPKTAKRMGIEGEARVLATIGVDGSVEDVRVLRRIEGWDDMNDAAEKAVKRYKFSPAQKGGVKVRTIVNLSVAFRLGQDVQAPHMK